MIASRASVLPSLPRLPQHSAFLHHHQLPALSREGGIQMSGGEEKSVLQPDSLAGTNPWLTGSAWVEAGCKWPSSCLGELAGAPSWCGTLPAARAQHLLPTALPQHRDSLRAPSAPAWHQRCDSTVTPVRQQGHREPWCRGGQENTAMLLPAREALRGPAVMNSPLLLVYSSLQQMSPCLSTDSSSGGMLFQTSPSNPY